MLPGVYVSREGWDSNAPGMSGVWYEVHILKNEVENVWTSLNNLLKHLRNMLAVVQQGSSHT